MKIKRIQDILEDSSKLKFTNELLDTFDKMGLGVLSKADFEAYLYYLLKKYKKSELIIGRYEWVRLLKVTPNKLNSMQTLSSVKFESLEDKKVEIIDELVRELSKNKIEICDLERQRLSVYISDMHIKLFLESFAAENGYAIGQEANPNISVIQFELFLRLLDVIEKHFEGKYDLRKDLSKQLEKDNQLNELKEVLKTKMNFTQYFIKKLGKGVEKQLYAEAIKILGNSSLQLFLRFIQSQSLF